MNPIYLIYIWAAAMIGFAVIALAGFLITIKQTFLDTPQTAKPRSQIANKLIIAGIVGLIVSVASYYYYFIFFLKPLFIQQ